MSVPADQQTDPPEQCPAGSFKKCAAPEEQRMGDEPLKPMTIWIVNQMLPTLVGELCHVAKGVPDGLRSLALSAMLRRRARPISDPSLVHAFVLPFALPVEALQHLRH